MDLTPIENVVPWWNLIVTARDDGFSDTKRALRRYGRIWPTHFYNVLVADVGNIYDFLHDFSLEYSMHPYLQDAISRIRPLTKTFTFDSRENFEVKAKEVIAPWIDLIRGKSYHLRFSPRGKIGLSHSGEEKFLGRFVLEALEESGDYATLKFHDSDFIIDIETVDYEAGMAIWTREELTLYSFLKLD